MKNKGFTLIELLAVIVILAIIALIAVPIILNIVNDSKEESNERSVEAYAKAIENAVATYQLENNSGLTGQYTADTLPFTVEYDGDVVCDTIEIYEDGEFYLDGCNINKTEKEYTYGEKIYQKGDIDKNGQIKESDVILLSKHLMFVYFKYSLVDSSLIIGETDINGDGKTTILDVNLLSKNIGYVKTVPGILGDANSDGEVTESDLLLLQQYLAKEINDSQITLSNLELYLDEKISVRDLTYLQKLLSE